MGQNIRVLLISLLLAVSLYVTYGIFSVNWITVLPIVFALTICSLRAPDFFHRYERLIALIVVLAFLGVAAVSMLPDTPWLRSMIVDVADQQYLPWMRGLFVTSAVFTLGLFIVSRIGKTRAQLALFASFLIAMLCAYALIMPTSPRAQIDVWTVHEEGVAAFVNLENPYKAEYSNIFPEELRPILTPGGVTYSYLPGTFMWMAPWKLLGLDTRYSQLLTRLLTSVLLLLIAWRARGRLDFLSFVPSLLFMTFPVNVYYIARAWNDDISIMFYAVAAWALLSRRTWAFFIACNALLVLKHHAIFFVPMFLWMAYRVFDDRRVWAIILKSTWAAALIHAGYLLAGWRDYLGSLYGLTFLKFPNVHHVFPDRRDPFSLMNYLHLFTGFKTSVVFPVVMGLIAFVVVRQSGKTKAKTFDMAAALRGTAAMAFGMFIFSPIAFVNYYQFALALSLISLAAWNDRADHVEVTWEIKTDWWLIGYVASRAAILFVFSQLIVETRYFHSVANMISADRMPYFDFGFNFLPFALIPAVGPKVLQSIGGLQAFIGYHTWFQLIVVAFDAVIAFFVFARFRKHQTSKTAMALFVFGPLLLAPLYFTSATIVTIAFTWLAVILIGKTKLYSRVTEQAYRNRRSWFLTGVVLAFSLIAIGFLAAEFLEVELNMNSLLSPTAVLIWLVCLIPLLPVKDEWSRALLLAKVSIGFLISALALTFFLTINIEAVVDQKSGYDLLVLVRNLLTAVSLLTFSVYFYRSRIATHDQNAV